MSDFIFSQTKKTTQQQTTSDFFTIHGKEDYIDENNQPRCSTENSPNVFAKRVPRDDGSFRYSIKLDNNGKIYNPFSIYGETKVSSFLDRVCRSQNKYKDVNQKAFGLYLSFLRTKNIAWLHNAEREI